MNFAGFTKIAVIGARGEMGRVLCDAAGGIGLEVAELNRPLSDETLAKGIAGAEAVFLSVPITAVPAVAALAAAHMDEGQIMADVCSVKATPVRQMLEAHPGPVVGTHPLFGGALPPPGERKVAVVEGRSQEAAGRIFDLVGEMGFNPFYSTAAEHDQALAFIQGLNFVTTVSYLSTGARQPGVEKFLTPSFKRRLEAAKKMLMRDAEMFEAMFESNPYSLDTVRLFRSHLNVAAGGDVGLLADRAGWWWSDEANGETKSESTQSSKQGK